MGKVKIREIAERLGNSAGTVSKGLNGGNDISESLRRQILDTAVEMGYTARRSMAAKRRDLCLFIENMTYVSDADFGHDLVLGFQQTAFRNKWNVNIVEITPEFQASRPYDNYMLEQEYPGAYLLGLSLEDPWMKQFPATAVPTVLLDNRIDLNAKVASVSTNSAEGIDQAISHLIRLGHKKIAFLDGSSGSRVSDDRMELFLRSMTAHQMEIDPDLAAYSYFSADAAHYHVPGLVARGATAILCGNDAIAEGVISSLTDMKLNVPEDISVIGFDDLPTAASMEPPLTTIRQDRSALGRCAFFALQTLIEGVPLGSMELRSTLITRYSTATANPLPAEELAAMLDVLPEEHDSLRHVNPALMKQYALA